MTLCWLHLTEAVTAQLHSELHFLITVLGILTVGHRRCSGNTLDTFAHLKS